MKDKKYYTVQEVAEYFKMQPDVIRVWIRKGILKANRVNDIFRISIEDLKELIDNSLEG